MTPQTYSFWITFEASGLVRWDLARKAYPARANQKGQLLASGYVDDWAEFPRLMDQLADMIRWAYELGDGAVQMPLPL